MFGTADIFVNRAHAVDQILIEGFLVIFIIDKTELVPAGADKGVQSVRVTQGRTLAGGTACLHKLLALAQGGFAIWCEGHIIRQFHRQLVFRYRNHATLVTVDNGDWCAPVALAGDQPVTQAVIYPGLAHAPGIETVQDGLDSLS